MLQARVHLIMGDDVVSVARAAPRAPRQAKSCLGRDHRRRRFRSSASVAALQAASPRIL